MTSCDKWKSYQLINCVSFFCVTLVLYTVISEVYIQYTFTRLNALTEDYKVIKRYKRKQVSSVIS